MLELELELSKNWIVKENIKRNIKQHLPNIETLRSETNSRHGNVLNIVDLNSETSKPSLDEIYETHNIEYIKIIQFISKIFKILHAVTT